VRGYRDSLAATPSIATLRYGVTTHWGLAAALDRSGDLSAALDHIRVARTYDPGDLRINGADWLFVPLHDEHWYHALGHWQRARAASTSEERLAAYREAIHAYTRYIEHAANNDRWVVLAEQRQRQCEHELRGAMKRPR